MPSLLSSVPALVGSFSSRHVFSLLLFGLHEELESCILIQKNHLPHSLQYYCCCFCFYIGHFTFCRIKPLFALMTIYLSDKDTKWENQREKKRSWVAAWCEGQVCRMPLNPFWLSSGVPRWFRIVFKKFSPN